MDYVWVVVTVGTDLVSLEALKEAVLTAAGCAATITDTIEAGIEQAITDAAASALSNAAEAALLLAQAAAMRIAKNFFEGLLPQ
jgi:hypothetical protein